MEQNSEKKASNRGGYREGAGRKRENRTCRINMLISPEAKAVLDQQQNKTEFIDNLLKDYGKKHVQDS